MIRKMTEKFQIDHWKATPYHPQKNSQIESIKQPLVSILRKTVQDSK